MFDPIEKVIAKYAGYKGVYVLRLSLKVFVALILVFIFWIIGMTTNPSPKDKYGEEVPLWFISIIHIISGLIGTVISLALIAIGAKVKQLISRFR